MSQRNRARRLVQRLTLSHALATTTVAMVAAAVVYAVAFFGEDDAYARIVRALLERASADQGAPDSPLFVGPLREASEATRRLATTLPDGIHEADSEGFERHFGLRTDSTGTRWVAELSTGELESDHWLALSLALGVVLAFAFAIGAGYVVSRRSLDPLERLAQRFAPGTPTPTPGELRAHDRDDEIGLLAEELASFLEQQEQALAREHQFVRDASHELRNPLSVLHGAVQLMRATGVGDAQTQAERLARMERSIARMRRTVDELLALARQESALPARARRPLSDTATELVEDFEARVGSHVELRLETNGFPSGSPDLWWIILRNLLDNAARATERGSIEVSLSPTCVTVTDTGAGIASARLAPIVRSFRGHNARPGQGLGLGIVQRLSERLGWSVALTSSLEGTRVKLTKDPDEGSSPRE